MSISGFNNQMHLHLSSFVCNVAQTTSWSGLSDWIYIRLGGYLHLVFSGSAIPIRNNAWSDHWPGVNSPLKFSALIFWVILQNRCNWAPCYIWEAYSNSIIKWYCLHVLSTLITCWNAQNWVNNASLHSVQLLLMRAQIPYRPNTGIRVIIRCLCCWYDECFHVWIHHMLV